MGYVTVEHPVSIVSKPQFTYYSRQFPSPLRYMLHTCRRQEEFVLTPSARYSYDRQLPTALAGNVKQSLASVRPSVCPFLCPLCLLNRLTFQLEFLYVHGS